MGSHRLKQFLSRLDELPALPPVAVRLVSMMENPESSPLEVSRVIESDAALTSKVLHLANSASVGLSRDITTVEHAASLLGLDVLRNMALSLVLINLFEAETEQGLDARKFWRHCLACGLAAELLARPMGYKKPKEAFVAGLLHDVGKIIFYYWDTVSYNQVIRNASATLTPLLAVEEETLEFGHTLAAKLIMEYWNFPAPLISAAWLHHQPLTEMGTRPSEQLPFLVKCANNLCHLHQYGDSGNLWPEWNEKEFLEYSGLQARQLQEISKRTFERLTEISSLFDWEDSSADLYLEAIGRINAQLTSIRTELADQRKNQQNRRTLSLSRAQLLSLLEDPISFSLAQQKVLEFLARSISCEALLLFLPDSREQTVSAILSNPGQETSTQITFGLTKELEKAGNPVKQFSCFQEVVSRRIELQPGAREIHNFLAQTDLVELPLKSGNQLLGQIVLRPQPAGPLNQETAKLLLEYADSAALVLNQLIRFEHLNQQAEFIARTARESEREHFRRYQSRRLESVGRLAAGAAHEINNPLAVILGKAQIGLETFKDSEVRQTLETISEQSHRISRIVQEMMGLTRQAEPNPAPTEMPALLGKTVGFLEDRLRSSGIDVVMEIQDDLPPVVADPDQLEQVFTHLILNAVYIMPNGGTLTIRAFEMPDKKRLTVQLEDTGPKMESSELRFLFDPFYRSADSHEGTGLGLSICHTIIEAQAGTIQVQSRAERGTVFSITLPLSRSGTAEPQESEQPDAERSSDPEGPDIAKSSAPSILIVDDEASLSDMLLDIFRRGGYRVETAGDGLECLDKLSQRRFDVILLDLRMPGKGGLEVLESIHGMELPPPVIVISGIPSEEELEQARCAGALACLKKPFDIEELTRLVKQAAGENPTVH